MIIPPEDHRGTVFTRATEVGMLKNVPAAVDAWPFAIPETIDPVYIGARKEMDALTTHDRGGGEFFVDPWLMDDVMLVQQAADAGESQVIAAQG